MPTYAEFDQVWLVKSAGMVLGPFSINELAEALRDHRVAILDEVRNPRSRWNFIREFPELASVVKQIREAQERHERTDVAIDLDTTQPEWQTDNLDAGDEHTPVPNSQRRAAENQERKPLPEFFSPKTTAETGGRHSPQVLRRSGKSSSQWIGYFFAGVLFAGISLAALYYIGARHSVDSLSSEDLLKLAQLKMERGLYDRSLDMFHRAKELGPISIYQELTFVPELLLSATGATEVAEVLNRVPDDWDPDRLSRWKALMFMQMAKYHDAEDILDDLLSKNSTDMNLHINRMVDETYLGNNAEVLIERNFLSKQKAPSPLVTLVPAFAELSAISGAQSSEQSVRKEAGEALQLLQNYTQDHEAYRFEANVLASLLALKVAPGMASALIAKLFELNPGQSSKWIVPLEIDNGILEPRKIATLVEHIAEQRPSEPEHSLLLAESQLLSDQKPAALARLQALPPGPVTRRLRALTELELNQLVEARNDISGDDTGPLDAEIMARTCLRLKDFSCVEAEIPKLSGVVLSEITARLSLVHNRADQAKEILDKALAINKNYRPFVEIQEEILGH